MVGHNRWVSRLSWALVVLVIISAVAQLGLALGLFVPFPAVSEETPFVDRLMAFRTSDQQIFGIVAVGAFASLGVFLIGGLLGVALRPLAKAGTARDLMATLFVLGGGVGIVAQLVNISTAQMATQSYCDCGFRDIEVIAQDYALTVGWNAQVWLGLAATILVGVGAALAGRLVAISPAWRMVSYALAAVLLFAAFLRLLGIFVRFEAFDPFQVTDLIIGLASAILVPIWAILLAVAARRRPMSDPITE